jgi:tRNA (mo5U34)-methyltransferase
MVATEGKRALRVELRKDTANVEARVQANQLWYHTMDLGGVVTNGWFDLRPIVDRLPWPDVRGKRCLDVGTFDGFLAFELERRGAAEVVCTDVPSHADWDHLPRQRAEALAFWASQGGEKGAGFAIAKDILGSRVTREWINIYDLSPERLGTFDVVVCGTLLLHLRSPFHALEALRSVCTGQFMSCEQIDPRLSIISRRRPALFLEGDAGRWMVGNTAAHVRLLTMAGFDVEQRLRYSVPFGTGHPPRPRSSFRDLLRDAAKKVVSGAFDGVPHSGALTRVAL